MPSQLPSGRWRTRVRHPRTRKQLSARSVIGGPETYATMAGAEAAEAQVRDLLRSNPRVGVTVAEFWHEWISDPLWQRPARSTNLHNRERTSQFVAAHADRPLRSIGDAEVAAWLRGGRNRGTVGALRVFFSDASSAAAGRLVDRNPFAKLGLPGSRGRRDRQPPSQAEIAGLVELADELTPPSFAPTWTPPSTRAPVRANWTRWAGRRSTSRPARSRSPASGTSRCASSRRPSTASCARSP
jgi:hypothetical protein